jgi:hypothetical protein
LRRQDIDSSGATWHGAPALHKESHKRQPRILCFNAEARGILGRYLLRAPHEYLFKPAEANDYQDKRWGPCYTAGALRHRVEIAQTQYNAGKPEHEHVRWTPYQIRNTVATEIRAAFGDSEKASRFLGHKLQGVANEHYIEHAGDTAEMDAIAEGRG